MIAKIKKKFMALVFGVMTCLMTAVPAFAVDSSSGAAIDPAAFDPLLDGITSNVSAVLPKILVVVGLLIGIGVILALVKRHASGKN